MNALRTVFFFFLHVCTKGERKIQTNNLRFIDMVIGPSQLSYLGNECF